MRTSDPVFAYGVTPVPTTAAESRDPGFAPSAMSAEVPTWRSVWRGPGSNPPRLAEVSHSRLSLAGDTRKTRSPGPAPSR